MSIVTHTRYLRGKTFEKRPFWENTRRDEETGCIEWTGKKHWQGYGCALKVVGEPAEPRAHRRAWAMTYGPIPDGLHVLHRCDNPACVNPEHLFLGTDADNSRDKYTKGRGNNPRGSRHGMSRFVAQDVRRIREAYLFGARPEDLRKVWGVSDSAIHLILKRKNWAHLE